MNKFVYGILISVLITKGICSDVKRASIGWGFSMKIIENEEFTAFIVDDMKNEIYNETNR